jgi:hypothetical protein
MTSCPRILPLQVCLLATVFALGSAVTAHAQTTGFFFHSQPGHDVGQGRTLTYTPATATFEVRRNSDGGVDARIDGLADNIGWSVGFAGANDAPLTVGTYNAVRGYPYTYGNGISFGGGGTGCGEPTGRFEVLEIVRAANGAIERFAIDFEIHCFDKDPGLYGALRYNSTNSSLNPFQGNYPRYQLTITPHPHGRVTAAGVDCGSSATSCQAVLSAPATLTLTATPDPGYVFAGWTGDCDAPIAAVQRINGPKVCAAHFEPVPATAARTLLFLDSLPGDPAGNGIDRIYSLANSTWRIGVSPNHSQVEVHIENATDDLRLAFGAPKGTPLAPGTYEAVRRFSSTATALLDVSLPSGCTTMTGRFVILELVINASHRVERFAADFEQHCNDADPALVGSIRYESTIGDGLVPFQGNYPQYQITITPAAHGRVTGTGIDCGSNASACQRVLSAPESVTLTAVPDAGYFFAGWLGDCYGPATESVRVNGPKTCSAFFAPIVTTAARTVLVLDSEPGDTVRGGVDAVFAPSNSEWSVTLREPNVVSVEVTTALERLFFDFASPDGTVLQPGYYGAARRHHTTWFNGLSAEYKCTVATGRFVVLEYVRGPNWTIERLAIDFEQHCEDADPGLFGSIRYNSTIPEVVPFGGSYPLYRVTLTQPAHGHVTATGLNCGGAATQCQVTSSSPMQLTLTATPDPGYLFAGWTEDCSGGPTTTVHVNGPKRCAALFEPTIPTGPRTLLTWDSEPTHPVGKGKLALSAANSRWNVRWFRPGNAVSVDILSVGPLYGAGVSLDFWPPAGQAFEVGRTYTGAQSDPTSTAPELTVNANGSQCSGGQFTVLEFTRGPDTSVTRLAIDFELICPFGNERLTGSLRYRALGSSPAIAADPPSLQFGVLFTDAGPTAPEPQTIRLAVHRNDIAWTAQASQPWASVTPSSGVGSAIVTVRIDPTHIDRPGDSPRGTVTFSLADGSGWSDTVDLLVVRGFSGMTQSPFGSVDTPLPDRTGVTGAIPITGWALDDVEVMEVTICRAAVAGESVPVDPKCGGTAKIYVGNGIFIEGARPDVQATYPDAPRSNAAGWGFMLLTNTLPNRGNGTFVFSIYARDREGRVTLLGTRAMTCDNAHASLPFGTIDTPLQGATIAGSSYVNFGWALTQNPKSIPIDGSTLMVYVDGVPIGNPSYNHHRPDIAAIFPGLANSNGAIGFKIIDTTTLANGLHTIAWTASDSAGAIAGLGSRYFRVLNGATNGVTTTNAHAAMATTTVAISNEDLAALPEDPSLIAGRRSWNANAPWNPYAPGRAGRATLRGEELDRFEIALAATDGQSYTGYLRVGDQLHPLPAGSHLDAGTGAFTWAPGVGFVGTYDVVFVRSAGGRAVARREVRFILQPKGSGHVGVQAVIDTPRARQDLAQPFAIGGWAIDLDAATGTGIETVHAWAYPANGGPPTFLGATNTFGARPDVAAVHGDQFRDAGFGVLVQGLPPDAYDLAVFPWSAVIGAFTPPQSVRVSVR